MVLESMWDFFVVVMKQLLKMLRMRVIEDFDSPLMKRRWWSRKREVEIVGGITGINVLIVAKVLLDTIIYSRLETVVR